MLVHLHKHSNSSKESKMSARVSMKKTTATEANTVFKRRRHSQNIAGLQVQESGTDSA